MRKLIILSILMVLIFAACNDPALYREKAEFPSGIWMAEDTVVFSTVIQDTSKSYDIHMEVSHDPEFSFQNLYVKVLTSFPNDSIADQVLSLQLSDGKGRWAGDCKSACNVKIPLSDSVRIRQAGPYAFKFIQYSRNENLRGINALEFSLAEHN